MATRKNGDGANGDHRHSAKLTPRELYLQEKARRAKRPREIDERLAAAEREYRELLANQAAAGRGGRPKKVVKERAGARKRAD